MELTPEIKAQLEQQKQSCIFCKILRGEIPGKTVFEDEFTTALLDIHPLVKGHTLYLLKEHYPIMPYIPGNEFTHFFGLIPQVAKKLSQAMAATAITGFIANGGVAGQTAPHFLMHLFPRDSDDMLMNFLFKKGETLDQKDKDMLAHNLPIMMSNHFKRHPASWHTGKGNVPSFLSSLYHDVVYEDEKVLCVYGPAAKGHLIVYSKIEEKFIEKLSSQDAAHFAFAASFAATAVFEGLRAQGTNIILKSGVTVDNPDGRLAYHVLPRWQGDSLGQLQWQPSQPSYNIDAMVGQIKDNMWGIEFVKEIKEIEIPQAPLSTNQEIAKAIEQIREE